MTQEALKLALDALEGADQIDCDMQAAITAIKEALAQRTWVGLTVEEIAACCRESTTTQLSFYNAIEAKLKEKNI